MAEEGTSDKSAILLWKFLFLITGILIVLRIIGIIHWGFLLLTLPLWIIPALYAAGLILERFFKWIKELDEDYRMRKEVEKMQHD